MANPPRPPRTVSPESFYAWAQAQERLDFGLYFWLHYVFSRALPLPEIASLLASRVNIQQLSHLDIPSFTITRRVGRDDRRRLAGWFLVLPTAHPSIYKIATVNDRRFWQYVILPLVRSHYPRLAPVYFMQRDLQRALDALQAALPRTHRLNLVRASTKERIGRRPRTSQLETRRYRSNVTYTHESLELAFQLAHERGQWFKSLTLDVERVVDDRTENLATVTLAKDGWISWDSLHGRFDLPLERALLARASERLELYSNRGRAARNYAPDVPLQIDFQTPVFDDRKAFRTFNGLMLRYPRSAKAVLHQNPYYHMSLCDEADGSAFDIWVLSSRRVLLVPRLQASEPAINRLVNYVLENFRDARVSNYTLSD